MGEGLVCRRCGNEEPNFRGLGEDRLMCLWCGYFSKADKIKVPRMTWEKSQKILDNPAQPTIVCLCGSTRFYEAFMKANYEETMAGKIVLSVGFYLHRPETYHSEDLGCSPAEKIALDALHFRKIELADEVLILNVGGYIGYSTRNELNHAKTLGKVIRYLEAPE